MISGGKPGPHKIQGIGAGFIPKNLDTSLLSGVETVSNDEAFTWARRLAKEEGILGGISTGGNVAAAVRVAGQAREPRQGRSSPWPPVSASGICPRRCSRALASERSARARGKPVGIMIQLFPASRAS